jgi:hypothetical protein
VKDVRLSYHYGFAADLGGGTYPRSGWLVKQQPAQVIDVLKTDAIDTLKKAVAAWADRGRPDAIIVFHDNRTYEDTDSITIDPPPGVTLIIEARDRTNAHIRATQPIALRCGEGASVTFSGLLIEGTFEMQTADGRLRLLHTTIAPDAAKPGIAVSADVAKLKTGTLRVEAAFSILGALQLPPHGRGIALFDCIVDGAGRPAITGPSAGKPGPALHVERSSAARTSYSFRWPASRSSPASCTSTAGRKGARGSASSRPDRTPRAAIAASPISTSPAASTPKSRRSASASILRRARRSPPPWCERSCRRSPRRITAIRVTRNSICTRRRALPAARRMDRRWASSAISNNRSAK